jgi:hypothetical protein
MHSLAINIERLHRRLVRQERLVAACRTFAVVVAVACVLGIVDYLVRFHDRGLRVMVSAALAAAAVWAAYRWWWLPRQQRPGPLGVARRVEAKFPQLGDRLASALEFLGQDEHDATAGSAALRRAVVADADLAVSELPIDDIVDRRPQRRAAIATGLVLIGVAALLLVDTSAVVTGALRLATPWGNTEWPRQHHLAFRDPPTRLAAGQPFEVELIDRDGTLPEEVRIEYRTRRDGRRETQSEWMNRVGDVMVARRSDVRDSFAFRAEGGDDRTMPWHEVEVVEPPRLESIAVTVRPPVYTHLPAEAANGHLQVLAGSGIEITGTASEPLGAARIRYGDAVVEGTIRADEVGNAARAFTIPAERFLADQTGDYELELANSDGVAGAAGKWSLRVEPDTPPSVTWQRPQVDLYVLPSAIVPIAVAVKDNLAIADAALIVTRSGDADSKPRRVELYRDTTPTAANAPETARQGDSQTIEYTLAIAELNAPVGTQLVLEAVATDHRPDEGRTVAPRRITIIDREELDARLADRQTQIARRLEEALASQRKTRNDVERLEIQLRDVGELAAGDRQALEAAEYAQRRIARQLVDPHDGISPLVNALRDELRTNGVESADLTRQLDNLDASLAGLAAGPLPTADQELTAARKSAQAGGEQAAMGQSLAAAGAAEDQVARSLEETLRDLAGWADYGRLVRDLAQLREDQLSHVEATRRDIGVETLPLELRELNRQQRATLNKAAAGEEALVRRYEQIEETLERLAGKLAEGDTAAADRVEDALALARAAQVSGNMRQAARELAENRVGQALVRESDVARVLEAMLDVLRDRTSLSPEELIARLKAAGQQLAAMRTELAKLARQVAAAENAPQDANRQQRLDEIRRRQAELQKQVARLSRELARLDAADASRSTDQAAQKLDDPPPPNDQQPANSRDMQQAEQHLAEAQKQLAQRQAQAEDDWAQKFLDRFKVALAEMVTTQKRVLANTDRLDRERGGNPLDDAQRQQVAELAALERQLADEAHVHSELISGLRVFGQALARAIDDLESAAEELQSEATGDATQRAERQALERFEQITWALEQTAAQAQQPPPPGQPGNAGAGGQQPRPLFDLFEVKLLRALQVDLNERTAEFEQQTSADPPETAQDRDSHDREAEAIAAEQTRLAELAAELAARNNEKEAEADHE